MEIKQLKNRLEIIELSYKAGSTHLGSALSAVDIIEAIFEVKKAQEKFILSCGHAATALYAVLKNHHLLKNPDLKTLGYHPERNARLGIDVSTGSLGLGLPIAVGLALADRKKNVYCCISDGECDEGSTWEALRVAVENNLTNLKVVINCNGFSAYRKTNPPKIKKILRALGWKVISLNGHHLPNLKKSFLIKNKRPIIIVAKTRVNQLFFLNGIDAHYYKMTEKDYQQARKKWLKN